MWFQKLFASLTSTPTRRRPIRRRSQASRLCLEPLEGRRLLAFLAPVDYPAGTDLQAVVTADFNNDGQLDLATADHGAGGVSVLLGDGQGGFGTATGSASDQNLVSMAVGNFNLDGKLDLVGLNSSYGDVNAMLSNGDGAFQDPTCISIGSGTTSVAVGDFNGDGTMDLAVTSNGDIYYPDDEYGNGGVLMMPPVSPCV